MSKEKKKIANRGNLSDFFDPFISEQLERPRSASSNVGKQQGESRMLTASMSNGQLQLNRKLLQEECSIGFQDKWFFGVRGSVLPVRFERYFVTIIAIVQLNYCLYK
jgi:hypothetical protein